MNFDDLELTFLHVLDLKGDYFVRPKPIRNEARAALTDLAILTGAKTNPKMDSSEYYVSNKYSLKGLSGNYFTKSFSGDNKVYIKTRDYGWMTGETSIFDGTTSIRLLIKNSKLYDELYKNSRKENKKIREAEFGEYPQYAPNKEIQQILETRYQDGQLTSTGKEYTFNNMSLFYKGGARYSIKTYPEYIYKNKKYIRVIANRDTEEEFKLSNNEVYKHKDAVWVEVSPVTWLLYKEKKTKSLLAKHLLLSGVPFHATYIKDKYREGFTNNDGFIKTDIYNFINTYMLKDLIPSITKEQSEIETETDQIYEIITNIKKYIRYAYDKESVIQGVEKAIDVNNKELDVINENIRNETINLKLSNSNTIYKNTIDKLNVILDNLKKEYEETKTYYDMLDIIEECKYILSANQTVESTIDTIKLFNGIIIILTGNNQRNEHITELTNILNDYENEIKEYLKTLPDKKGTKELKYNTVKDFELSLLKDIQLVLFKIQVQVTTSNIPEKIMENALETMRLNFEKAQEQNINNFLDSILKEKMIIIQKIKLDENRYSYYKNELNKTLNFRLDRQMSKEEINNTLTNVFSSLIHIQTKINEEIETNKHRISKKIKWETN